MNHQIYPLNNYISNSLTTTSYNTFVDQLGLGSLLFIKWIVWGFCVQKPKP